MSTLETLLPHRKPMLLLDSIVLLEPDEIVVEKTIHADAFFLQGHYPGYPIVPGIITCECLFQAGAALLAHRLGAQTAAADAPTVPVVARIQNAKFRDPIRPGDQVFYRVKITETVGTVFYLKGEARVGNKLKATAEFACALAPRQP